MRGRWWRWLVPIAAVVIIAVLPQFVSRAITFRVATALVLVLFAAAFNLLLGGADLISFGHVALYGVGGYTAGILIQQGFGMGSAMLAGVVLAVLAAVVIGYLSLRAEGIQFAMLSLALSQVIYLLVYRLRITGGQGGLPGIIAPSLNLFGWSVNVGSPDRFYYVVLAVVALSLWLIWLISSSGFGRLLRATREDSIRTLFLGVAVKRVQLTAFVISGAFAALAGTLNAMLQGIVTPESLLWSNVTDPLIAVLLGGVDTFLGPILGAIGFEWLKYITRNVEVGAEVYSGFLILVVVFFFPRGLVSLGEQAWSAVKRRLGV